MTISDSTAYHTTRTRAWRPHLHNLLRTAVRAQPVLATALAVVLGASCAALIRQGELHHWLMAALLALPAALAAADSHNPAADDEALLGRSLRMACLIAACSGPLTILALIGALR